MTYDPIKPRYTLEIGKEKYELEGSFGLLEAVENAVKDNVLSVMMRCPQMPVSELSKVIHAMLVACNHKITLKEVGDIIVNDIGISTQGYAVLCLHVHAFLRIIVAPPIKREEESKKMGELLAGIKTRPDSPGSDTANSASAL